MNGTKNIKNPKYLLDLRTFVVDKLPDDGNLMPKHVAVGSSWYEACFVMFYFILISVFCWVLKIRNEVLHVPPSPSRQMPEHCFKFGHARFLSNRFQFVIH